MDPELGRCRRTDGKKWCCSRDVVAGQKYCKRHVDRGRNHSRQPGEIPKPSIPGGSSGGGVLNLTLLASQLVSSPTPHSIDVPYLNQSSGLMNRWSVIQSRVNKYSDCVCAIERSRTSRYNVEESIGAANQSYYNSEGHHFKWDGCWLLLKDSPKWLNYRGKQISKKQKTAHTNVEGFNVGLHQTIDSSTPATTPSLNAGSGSLDDENSPFVKESHELPQPCGRKPTENICRKKNVNELDAIKSFITEFRNLRKEQKEIAEQEISMLNK
ncbi:hypothetical protein RHMOL_Rhmol03G0087700 [Rhododendron molle]|uniref:Uncharacterized protein n=1 Tax=Rhododendron molle TaxID=49168 RepID=A0ACC0PDI5_RHOML|nr:hypothetical protein RHMOL_Rhmol03G0087700 [Rhododendron molle]